MKKLLAGMLILISNTYSIAEALLTELPEAKITVKVINESGLPVSDAIVGIGFRQGGNAWIGESDSENIKGLSDTNGLFYAQAKCTGSIGIGVEKEGFYLSYAHQDYPGTYQGIRQWEPWNPTVQVILKKIENPTAMYVKQVRADIPTEKMPIGFDLKTGDWVRPHGEGERCDFLFTFSRNYLSQKNYNAILTIDFSNKKDGIQETIAEPVSWMSLRLPHDAPASGYSTNKVWNMGYHPEMGSFGFENPDGDKNYFFRVRTLLGEDDAIEEAHYGKIHGPIRVTGIGRETAKIVFQYYFNPTPNDRNIEFDPEQNLFRNLRPSEQVRAP